MDGTNTTQTHRSTCAYVTRVCNDVKAGNLSLKSLVGRCKRKAFHFIHAHCLCSYRDFFQRNRHSVALNFGLSFYHNLLQLCIILQADVEFSGIANHLAPCFVANVANDKSVLRILDDH